MPQPTLDEALEWARRLRNEPNPLQLDVASQISIYASYTQMRANRRLELLTRVLMVLTVIVAFFSSAGYFALIPGVGYTYAPILGFIIFLSAFYFLKRESNA